MLGATDYAAIHRLARPPEIHAARLLDRARRGCSLARVLRLRSVGRVAGLWLSNAAAARFAADAHRRMTSNAISREVVMAPRSGAGLRAMRCAGEDLNLHGVLTP